MKIIISENPLQKTCKVCGSTDFNQSSECRPCKAARGVRYRAIDPENFRAKNRVHQAKFAAKDPDALRKKKRDLAENVRRKNGVKKRENNLESREKSKDLKRAYMAARRASGLQRELMRIWRAKNPEAAIVNSNNYRARKRENGGTLSKGIRKKLFALQKGKCACCGNDLGNDYHLDHRMPIALGGTNTDDNMQLLRKACNLQKKDKHPIDFMRARGFLL